MVLWEGRTALLGSGAELATLTGVGAVEGETAVDGFEGVDPVASDSIDIGGLTAVPQ